MFPPDHFQFVKLFLEKPLLRFTRKRDAFKPGVRDDDGIPIAGGDAAEKFLAVLRLEILLACGQDVCARIQRQQLGGELAEHVIVQFASLVSLLFSRHNARMNKQPNTQTKRERLTKLFEFLKAYTDLRYPPVRDITQQLRTLWLKDLPAHPSVELFRDIGKTDDETDDSDVALRLTRPTITACPPPPTSLSEWLKPGDWTGSIPPNLRH